MTLSAVTGQTSLADGGKFVSIQYGCILPLPRGPRGVDLGVACDAVEYQAHVEDGRTKAFTASSYPGGQVRVATEGAARVAFRWLCVSSDGGIGTAWTCYSQFRKSDVSSAWIALDHPYLFAAQGSLLNPPETALALNHEGCRHIRVVHPAGTMLCLPVSLDRVKILTLRLAA